MDRMYEVTATGLVWVLGHWWQILGFALLVDVVFWGTFLLVRWWIQRRGR